MQLNKTLLLCIILTKTVSLQDKTNYTQTTVISNLLLSETKWTGTEQSFSEGKKRGTEKQSANRNSGKQSLFPKHVHIVCIVVVETGHLQKRNVPSCLYRKIVVNSPADIQPYNMATMKKIFLPLILLLSLLSLLSGHNEKSVTIYMIGDSTMANKDLKGGNPERGWGFVLPGFFSEEVYIENHAQNGRSTKSFIDEGRWEVVRNKIKKGDYVFIQFGHNDEKESADRHTEPGSTFDDNLRRFINETRERGGKPVLFNSIVRRNFVDGELTDTHGEYKEAPRRVAQEMNVPFIDHNRLTHEWVASLGDEASRKYFMWIAPDKLACCPKGKEDNTHLNIQGAKIVALLAVQALAEQLPELKQYMRHYDIVVAQDGSGDVFNIQEAINMVPDYRKEKETRILIRKGTYKEKLIIPPSKLSVSLIGEDSVIITGNDSAAKNNSFGDPTGTSGSATCYIYGDDFYAENITFENTAGPGSQAVAALVDSDRAIFRNCRFLGNQDTLYPYGKNRTVRQYYKDCYIEGTVDFIFGWATAYFDNCTLHSKSKGYIAAPATRKEDKNGFVFFQCHLTADENVEEGSVYLGRPWRAYGQAVYLYCDMQAHIHPEGWQIWNNKKQPNTPLMGEYGCTGTGSDTSKRVSWAKKIKSSDMYTPSQTLGGGDCWDVSTVIDTKKEK